MFPSSSDDWPMFQRDLMHSGYTNASGPKTSEIEWIIPRTRTHNASVYSSVALVDGIVYAAFATGGPSSGGPTWVRAFYASNTTSIWETQIPHSVYSTPAFYKGYVYVGTRNNPGLYAFNATTGKIVWTYPANGVDCRPVVWADTVYFGGIGDYTVFAVEYETGKKIWSFPTSNRIMHTSPAIYQGTLFITSEDGYIYALNASSGSLEWKTLIGGSWSPPTVYNNIVYVGSHLGGSQYDGFYALNWKNGSKIWKVRTPPQVTSSAAIAYNTVYINSGDGLYALNASSGGLVFHYSWNNRMEMSSPAVADGVVYFETVDNSNDATIHAVDAFTGEKIWSYLTVNMWYYGCPAVVDGMMIISTGNLYAFGSPLPQMHVSAIANPSAIGENQTSIVKVNVRNDTRPLKGASVRFSLSGGGKITPISNSTDANGDTIATYDSRGVTRSTLVSVKISASALGYQKKETSVSINVKIPEKPRLYVTLRPYPQKILIRQTSTIWINVTDGANAVPNVTLKPSLNGEGGLRNLTNYQNLTHSMIYDAKNVTNHSFATITLEASKTGFIPGANSTTIEVCVPPKPKLLVTLRPYPSIIEIQNSSTIWIDVTSGNGTVPNTTLNTSLYGNGEIGRFVSYQNMSHSITYAARGMTAHCFVNITVKANKIGYDPGNASTTIEVMVPIWMQKPDLAVSANEMTFSDEHPISGKDFTLTVIIKNIGKKDARDCLVQIFDGNEVIESRTIPSINHLGAASLQITFKLTKGPHTISIEVDPYNYILEENEMNNRAERGLDVTSDSIGSLIVYLEMILLIAIITLVLFFVFYGRRRRRSAPDEG